MTDYEAAHQIKTYSKRGTVFNLRLIFGPNLCLLPLILIWGWFLKTVAPNIVDISGAPFTFGILRGR